VSSHFSSVNLPPTQDAEMYLEGKLLN